MKPLSPPPKTVCYALAVLFFGLGLFILSRGMIGHIAMSKASFFAFGEFFAAALMFNVGRSA